MRQAEYMGGKIVYGDTDSLFVRLPNKSLEEAFMFGTELVDWVGKNFPWPMKLVQEKVYLPCCLVTKKRYVGRAFDSLDAEPRLDAKGIETIRRDTCPAVAVTVERIINSIFSSSSGSVPAIIANLESICIKEFSRILRGQLPVKYFVFQNQVRDLSNYKDMNHLPPAARVAVDTGRMDAARGERIAYVITQGMIGSKLSEQVKHPSCVVEGSDQLNYEYYVTKQVIPAVQRIFGPLADRAYSWLQTARGRKGNRMSPAVIAGAAKLGIKDQQCLLCQSTTASAIFASASKIPLFCSFCLKHRSNQAIAIAFEQLRKAEKRSSDLAKLCINCAGNRQNAISCKDAFHCEVYFQRSIARKDLQKALADVKRL
jgi:DNA polymerase zeta